MSCPSASPCVCWEQCQGWHCRIPQPWVLGSVAQWGVQHFTFHISLGSVPQPEGDTPVIFCPLGGKLCSWGLCVCLQAAVAIAWPLALIILMAFHTPGKSLRTPLLGTGFCWLGNWDTAPGNITGSLHKMKLSSGWDLNLKKKRKKKGGGCWGKCKFRFNSIVNNSKSVITNRKFKVFDVKVLELTESLGKRFINNFCPAS